MPKDVPDPSQMSDDDVKRLFMSLARDRDHQDLLQMLIDALLEEYPDLTEGEIIRDALTKILRAPQPRGHVQEFGNVFISHVQNIFSSRRRPQIQKPNVDGSESSPEEANGSDNT